MNRRGRVLVLGDDCVDIYQWGQVRRLCPEAPVPVFEPLHQERRRGMASNLAENLQSLGLAVTVKTGPRQVKTRLIDRASEQILLRIDQDRACDQIELPQDLDSYVSVVISDYAKGSVCTDMVLDLESRYKGPIYLDSKRSDIACLRRTLVKINNLERDCLEKKPQNLITTMGRQGAEYQGEHFPAREIELVDACGAGDSFLAALVWAEYTGYNRRESIAWANTAAGISCGHRGVYAVGLDELVETHVTGT